MCECMTVEPDRVLNVQAANTCHEHGISDDYKAAVLGKFDFCPMAKIKYHLGKRVKNRLTFPKQT